jgi:hypothetical protein
MPFYTVTKVRRVFSMDGTHKHVDGVITSGGVYYTRRQVVSSLRAGHTWVTQAGGLRATITECLSCPTPGCFATPYIKTNPNSTDMDNLEYLPEG